MPYLKTYDLFISHAWKYGDDYNRLVAMLKDKPIVPPWERLSKSDLRRHLEQKIRPVNAVLVISGMYYYYHEWMQAELDAACDYHKPIIAIRPRGNETVPTEVARAASFVVGWTTSSIIDAIRMFAI